MKFRFLFTMAAIVSFTISGQAQKLSLDNQASRVEVSGTSSHNDWTVDVSEAEGTIELTNGIPSKVNLKFKVSSMDGGRGNIMNNLINKTLKEPEYPWIQFYSESISKVSGNPSSHFEAVGKLCLAGEEREVKISVIGDTALRNFKSETPLKFSSFDIKPPTALFGALKTGDEITVNCNLSFKSVVPK